MGDCRCRQKRSEDGPSLTRDGIPSREGSVWPEQGSSSWRGPRWRPEAERPRRFQRHPCWGEGGYRRGVGFGLELARCFVGGAGQFDERSGTCSERASGRRRRPFTGASVDSVVRAVLVSIVQLAHPRRLSSTSFRVRWGVEPRGQEQPGSENLPEKRAGQRSCGTVAAAERGPAAAAGYQASPKWLAEWAPGDATLNRPGWREAATDLTFSPKFFVGEEETSLCNPVLGRRTHQGAGAALGTRGRATAVTPSQTTRRRVPSREGRRLREHERKSFGKTHADGRRRRARVRNREGRPQPGNGCAPAGRQEVKLRAVWGSRAPGRDRARVCCCCCCCCAPRAGSPQVAAASSGKSAPDSGSPPRATTGPAGVHLGNAAGLGPGPGWTWKAGMLRNVHAGGLGLLPLRAAWALLLLAAADGGAAGPPKAVVRLEPPWFNVLREDDVTLHCQGPHGPADGPTQWSRDGTPIPAQVQPRFSFKANLSDSGDYRCQTGQTGLSDPVRLNVTSDWLLLQTPSLLLQEGDPLMLRCHSWQNRPLFKIQFLQDGVYRQYSPANSSFFVPHANVSHSGTYHCSGFIGRMKHESHSVSITVQGPASPAVTEPSLPWPQIAFCLVMGLLFAVDTGLYFSVWKDLRSLTGDMKDDKVMWSKSLGDK
ncbi:uncharacterized protein LOC123818297 [Phyllostomus hastatus]|uniref:uncharacterized protein LOC123818297 n=1 Tax=Phyllostomus hastatus TaxID=9423 RepID=UPI001E67E499|nr:uncharacterized protein LOC123818297 [Phyllostomus hastatus]